MTIRHHIIFLSALTFTACGASESAADAAPSSSADAQTEAPASSPSSSFPGRGATLNQYIDASEEMMNTSMLLYSRVIPDFDSKVKPIKFDAPMKAALECVVREARKAGMEDTLRDGLAKSREAADYIRNNSDVTLLTFEEDPNMADWMDSSTSDEMIAINQECGMISETMRLQTEAGIYEAMRKAPMMEE